MLSRLPHHQSDGMEPLEPGHHPAGVIAYQVGVDSVGIQHSLSYVRLDLVGKRSDHGVELG